jgi:hypothetical protein
MNLGLGKVVLVVVIFLLLLLICRTVLDRLRLCRAQRLAHLILMLC